MENFDYNGRNYKVANGMVHSADTAMLHPCYQGDNAMLDAYCEQLGVKLYQRPNNIHTHGHQKGEARKPQAMTKKWVPAGDADNIMSKKTKALNLINLIDWSLLRQQKSVLLGAIASDPAYAPLEGILVLIDSLQDFAVDELGKDPKDVMLQGDVD